MAIKKSKNQLKKPVKKAQRSNKEFQEECKLVEQFITNTYDIFCTSFFIPIEKIRKDYIMTVYTIDKKDHLNFYNNIYNVKNDETVIRYIFNDKWKKDMTSDVIDYMEFYGKTRKAGK